MSKLPIIFPKSISICIICEGSEEYEYLDKLNNLNVWHKQYTLDLVNAYGNGNIPARYQDKYQNGSYDVVLVFCDTEKKPYEQYEDIKQKINYFHGNNNSAEQVIIFANPCTMQIIISHIKQVVLKSPGKGANAEVIKECFGIENYRGRERERKAIFEQINIENYNEMCSHLEKLSINDVELGSTNFLKFTNRFSSENCDWIDKINNIIESE